MLIDFFFYILSLLRAGKDPEMVTIARELLDVCLSCRDALKVGFELRD